MELITDTYSSYNTNKPTYTTKVINTFLKIIFVIKNKTNFPGTKYQKKVSGPGMSGMLLLSYLPGGIAMPNVK